MIVHQVISGKSGGSSGGRGRDVYVSEGVAEVVAYIGVSQFAARIRATDQLRRLYVAWRTGTGYDEGGISKKGYGEGGASKDTPVVSHSPPNYSHQQQPHQQQQQQQTQAQAQAQDHNGTRKNGDPTSNNSSNNNNHSGQTLNSPSPCANPLSDTCDSPLQYQSSPGPSSVCGSLMTMMERYCLTDTPYQY